MNKAVAKTQSPKEVMRQQVDQMDGEIVKVLPDHISIDKFKRVFLTAVNENPDLYNCNRNSLFAACLQAAQDGLLPDGRECALAIFGKNATYMPMIYGVLKKMRNSGELSGVHAHVVYEKDAFDYELGDDERISHKPAMGERGKAMGAYAIASLKDGTVEREYMSLQEIEKARAVSRSAKSGPWVTWWGQMARKTVIHRLAKRLPMSSDMETYMRRDEEQYDRTTVDKPPRPQRQDYLEHDTEAEHRRLTTGYIGDETEGEGEETDRTSDDEPENKTEPAAKGSPERPPPAGNTQAAEQDRDPVPEQAGGGEALPEQASLPATHAAEAAESGVHPPEPGKQPYQKRVVLYAGNGNVISNFDSAEPYFRSVRAEMVRESDPHAYLAMNEAGANRFVSADERWMKAWQECHEAAGDMER